MIWFFCLSILFLQETVFADIPESTITKYNARPRDKHFQERRPDEVNCTTGKAQSPIAIYKYRARYVIMEGLHFHGYDVVRHNVTVSNDGHTAKLTLAEGDEKPYIDHGGLGAKYTFSEIHFHWGMNNSGGAEHILSPGLRRVLEVHFVHSNPALAVNDSAGLAVLGLTFVRFPFDNGDYCPITHGLKDIRHKDQKTVIGNFTLDSLLPKFTRNLFYRYNGSLTTSPCSEGVIWSVFKLSRFIGEQQMEEFRSLLSTPVSSDEKKPIAPNFREPQPLNNRTIYGVFGLRLN